MKKAKQFGLDLKNQSNESFIITEQLVFLFFIIYDIH